MSLRQLLSPILRRFGVSNSISSSQRFVQRDIGIQSNHQVNRTSSFDEIRTQEFEIKTDSKEIPSSVEHTSSQEPTTLAAFATKNKSKTNEPERNFGKSSKSYENISLLKTNTHMSDPLTLKNGNNFSTTTSYNNSIKESKSNDELFVMTTKEFNEEKYKTPKITTKSCDDVDVSKGQHKKDATENILPALNIYPEVVCTNQSIIDKNINEVEDASKQKEFEEKGNSPRRTLQHRHTYNSFTTQESLSKDEARRRMLSWRKTTKMRKSTTPVVTSTTSGNNSNEIDNLTDKRSSNLSASRKRGVFIGSKKSHSMVQQH